MRFSSSLALALLLLALAACGDAPDAGDLPDTPEAPGLAADSTALRQARATPDTASVRIYTDANEACLWRPDVFLIGDDGRVSFVVDPAIARAEIGVDGPRTPFTGRMPIAAPGGQTTERRVKPGLVRNGKETFQLTVTCFFEDDGDGDGRRGTGGGPKMDVQDP